MPKKKNKLWIFILVSVVVIFLALAMFLLRPTTASIVEYPVGSAFCPQGSQCIATPILSCQNPQSVDKVYFRSLSDDDSLIGFNLDEDENMDCHRLITTSRYVARSTPLLTTPNGNIIVEGQYGQIGRRVDSEKYYRYQDSSCPLNADSVLPKPEYAGKEIYKGTTQAYICKENVYINGNNMDTLEWIDTEPTTSYSKKSYYLQETEYIQFNGIIKLESDTIPENTCTLNDGTIIQVGERKCVGNELVYCENINGLIRTTEIDCTLSGKVCNQQTISCQAPLGVAITLNGRSYDESENIPAEMGSVIELTVRINEPVANRREVIVGIEGGNQLSDISTEQIRNFQLTVPQSFGYKQLIISVFHESGTITNTYTLNVQQQLDVTVTSDNPVQYDSQQISVRALGRKIETYVNVNDWRFESEYNNVQISPSKLSRISTGIIEARYNLVGDGVLMVRSQMQSVKNGAWSDWSDWYRIDVKKSTVILSTDFINDEAIDTYKLSFQTKDSSGSLIDTANTVTIVRPDGTKETISTNTESLGTYSLTYPFYTAGLYTVKITSTHASLGSTQLNNGQGTTINILGGGGGDDTNWTLYGFIGVMVIGIIAVIYFFLRRKK